MNKFFEVVFKIGGLCVCSSIIVAIWTLVLMMAGAIPWAPPPVFCWFSSAIGVTLTIVGGIGMLATD